MPRASSGKETGSRLDEVDRRILRLLRHDGRLSVKSLARQVHVSRTTAYRRLERLEQQGVIRGFIALLDPARAGFPVSAVVLVSMDPERPEGAGLELLNKVPGIEYAAWVTGEVDLVLVVRATSMDELRDAIVWKVQRHRSVRATRTLMVFQESVNEPCPLP